MLSSNGISDDVILIDNDSIPDVQMEWPKKKWCPTM